MPVILDLHKQILRALEGDPEQEYFLGLRYYLGEDVVQDYKSSVALFTLAANHGFTRAQFHLGLMYYEGYGVERNLPEAYQWFLKAAAKGDIWGQYYCSMMSRNPQLYTESDNMNFLSKFE